MKEKLVVILGPTGVGKTALSLGLAKALNGEIISCDSMQIYKYMDIGSDKILSHQQEGIRHHMLDLVYPDEDFTVSDYKNISEEIISNLNSENKLPLLVGGTGLYINSLVYKLNFTKVEANQELRDELEEEAKEMGNEYVHSKLKKVDPESAERIHPNDLKRVIRALEIYKESGKTMAEYNKNFRQPNLKYDLYMVGLTMDRTKLYERINKRVDLMIEDGLLNEVSSLLEKGYTQDMVSMQGIGYKELIEYLEGNISLEESVELIKQKSRNYAKRQLTWFRRDERINWYNKDNFESDKDLEKIILKDIRKAFKLT